MKSTIVIKKDGRLRIVSSPLVLNSEVINGKEVLVPQGTLVFTELKPCYKDIVIIGDRLFAIKPSKKDGLLEDGIWDVVQDECFLGEYCVGTSTCFKLEQLGEIPYLISEHGGTINFLNKHLKKAIHSPYGGKIVVQIYRNNLYAFALDTTDPGFTTHYCTVANPKWIKFESAIPMDALQIATVNNQIIFLDTKNDDAYNSDGNRC